MSEDKNNIPAPRRADNVDWRRFRFALRWLFVIVSMVTIAVLLGEGCSGFFGFAGFACSANVPAKIAGILVVTPLIALPLWWMGEHLARRFWRRTKYVWRNYLPKILRGIIVVLTAILAFLLCIGLAEKAIIDLWPKFGFRESLVKDVVLLMFGVLGSVAATVLVWTMLTSKIHGAMSRIGERFRSSALLRFFFSESKSNADSHQQVANDESKAPVAEVAEPAEAPEPENTPAEIPAESEDKNPGRLKGAFSAVVGYAQTGGGKVIDTASKAGAQVKKAGGRFWDKLKPKKSKKGGD